MILSSKPAPALRTLIRYYYGVEKHLVAAIQPVPARSPQAIEFTFGTPYQVHRLDQGGTSRKAYSIAVIGAQTFRRVDLLMQGRVDTFTIVFQPGGISKLLSVPAQELTNNDFDGEAVLGRKFTVLERQMGDAHLFADRVRIANEYLTAMLPANQPPDAIVHAAASVLTNAGRARVSDLADTAGLGLRQFERRFRHQIGIPPKLYARIVRFEAALGCKAEDPGMQWTDIAHSLGYHDHMHMVHDFNRLAGKSPSAICGHLDMFVRPEVVSAERASLKTLQSLRR